MKRKAHLCFHTFLPYSQFFYLPLAHLVAQFCLQGKIHDNKHSISPVFWSSCVFLRVCLCVCACISPNPENLIQYSNTASQSQTWRWFGSPCPSLMWCDGEREREARDVAPRNLFTHTTPIRAGLLWFTSRVHPKCNPIHYSAILLTRGLWAYGLCSKVGTRVPFGTPPYHTIPYLTCQAVNIYHASAWLTGMADTCWRRNGWMGLWCSLKHRCSGNPLNTPLVSFWPFWNLFRNFEPVELLSKQKLL